MHTPCFSSNDRLAITGMALVNALGNNVSEVWENSRAMRSGLCTIRPLADDPPNFIHSQGFVPGQHSYTDVLARANLSCTRQDIDLPPQDFRAMSTSTRLTLLMAKQAIAASGLAQAGYAPDRIGVFISQNSGEAASTLWDLNLTLRANWLTKLAASVGDWSPAQQDEFYQRIVKDRVTPDESTMLCRLNCTAAGTICQRYGFTGPSYSVGAACSSSMAALYTAYTLIQAGSIDAAVVGGAEEGYAPLYFAEFSAIGALARYSEHITSPEAHSRPFDLHRNGFVLGEGAGLVVLERESYARKRHAPMHGLLTSMGSSTNCTGLIEPSASAQADAIRQSFTRLDYGPEDVDLVECHATATPQGDLAEAQSLAMCFGHKNTPTVLSGYKGQIGHTTGASGIISLIHGLCAMQDKVFPGTLNCETPDPALGLDAAKLRVLSTPEAWPSPSTGIRRMQVNTFGFGGSCFVAQMEEPNDRQPSNHGRNPAHAASSAASTTPDFQGQESVVDGTRMITLPHQGQVWRVGSTTPAWMNEMAGLATEPSAADLNALGRRGVWLSPPVSAPNVAVMCCGQGSVWPGMGRALYDTFPAARQAMDRIAKVADWDILGLMDEPSLEKIILTRWQQPYLFLLEYAQAHYLTTLGLKPTVMSGHSLGELIALCLAGVYTPETAWTILDTRSRFMAQLEADATNETGMMSVHCSPEVLEATLQEWPGLHVSNYNSPMQVILSGSRELLQEVRRTLRKRRVPAVLLNVSLAFHHPHMRALRDESVTRLLKLDYHAPQLPMMSNITTGLYPGTREEIVNYIADLDENSVRWVECVRNMWNIYGIRHFVELGPGDTLCGLVSDIEQQAVCVPAGRKDKEVDAMRTAVARLYAMGHLPMRTGRGGTIHTASAASTPPANGTVSAPTALETAPPAAPTTAHRTGCYEAHIEKVMPIIAKATGYTYEELQADMDLRHDLSIRSSRFPLIMHEAEQQFHIKLRFEDMLGVATIRDLAEVLHKLQETQAPVGTATAETAKQSRTKSTPASLPPVMRYSPRLFPISTGSDLAPLPAQNIIVAGPACAQVADMLGRYYSPEHLKLYPSLDEARALYASAPSMHGAPPHPAPLARGLVLALSHADTADLQPNPALLTDAFGLIKAFCASLHSGKDTPTGSNFCVIVQQETASNTPPSALEKDPVLAGLNGIALAAALEHPECIFRSVRLHGAVTNTWLAQVLQAPTAEQNRPVQWIFTGETAHSVQLLPRALNPDVHAPKNLSVRHGDIILVPGGAKGITPYALTALAPLKCTFIILGRSAADTTSPAASTTPLTRLTQLGSKVVHISCDVTDVAAVQQAVQDIVLQWGRIDGLIHAAGITRDATMDNLDAEAFSAVLQVKYQGLWACLEATRPAGLRYTVAFSSMAAWLGNYGQSNYCAANRAMTALLHNYGKQHGIATRALWLPPVLGVGMAAQGDMQEQLRLRGLDNAWLHCQELGDMLARELFCGSDADCIWARVLPTLPTVLAPSQPSHSEQVGQYEHGELFPLVYPVEVGFTQEHMPANPISAKTTPPAQARFVGGHHFSRYAGTWLSPQPTAADTAANAEENTLYTAPVSMLAACLVEAAGQTCPWLCPTGLYDFRVQSLPLCHGGVTRQTYIESNALPWEQNSTSIQRPCDTTMTLLSLSANGRKKDQTELVCQGRVGLSAAGQQKHLGNKVHADTQGQKWVLTPTIIDKQFPAAWLETCLQGAIKGCNHTAQAQGTSQEITALRLTGIKAMEWHHPLQQAPAQLWIHLQAASPTYAEQNPELGQEQKAFDGYITDEQGNVWMTIDTMMFTHTA